MRLRTTVLLVLLGTALAGCGDGGGGGGGEEYDPDANVVTIDGFSYAPATITLLQGDTVVFRNTHNTQHSATLDSRERDTGAIAPGGEAQFTVPTQGRHVYHCKFHPNMSGTIVVNEP